MNVYATNLRAISNSDRTRTGLLRMENRRAPTLSSGGRLSETLISQEIKGSGISRICGHRVRDSETVEDAPA